MKGMYVGSSVCRAIGGYLLKFLKETLVLVELCHVSVTYDTSLFYCTRTSCILLLHRPHTKIEYDSIS
jgi:hypothetical protein